MDYDLVLREIVGVWGGGEPSPFDRWVDEVKVIFVDEATVAQTQRCVSGCEHCAENAGISLDYLLDAIMGCEPDTDYLMCRPATCPCCSRELTEKTLVVAG